MSKNGREPTSRSAGSTTSSMNAATRARNAVTSSGSSKSIIWRTLSTLTVTVNRRTVVSMNSAPQNAADTELDTAVVDAWIGDRLPGTGERLEAERLGATT